MIFRTSGVYGGGDDALSEPDAERLGLALGTAMQGAAQVIIGRDHRARAAALVAAFGAGVRATGLKTLDIGLVATPVAYHASRTRGDVPAVMITGAGRPAGQMAFILSRGGRPFSEDEQQRWQAHLAAGDFQRGYGEAAVDEHAASRYMADLAGRFGDAPKPLKVVVDAGNGTAGLYIPTLLRYMRHPVLPLYCDPAGDFPHHPADVTATDYLLDAKAVLLTQSADLALVFEGDGSRVAVIDGRGVQHPADRAFIPLVWDVLKRFPGAPILVDVLASQVLVDLIAAAGGEPIMVNGGSAALATQMAAQDAPLGLSTDGAVYIGGEYYGYGDSLYGALRLVELLSRAGTAPLHAIMANVPQTQTTSILRAPCPADRQAEVLAVLSTAFDGPSVGPEAGVRLETSTAWVGCLPDAAGAALQVRFEAPDDATLENLVGEVAGQLAAQNVHLDI